MTLERTIFALLLCGWASALLAGGETPPATPQGKSTIDEKHAVEIAKQEVATREAWTNNVTFFPPQKGKDGGWIVLAWRTGADGKLMQSGQRLIAMDDKGVITKYLRGH